MPANGEWVPDNSSSRVHAREKTSALPVTTCARLRCSGAMYFSGTKHVAGHRHAELTGLVAGHAKIGDRDLALGVEEQVGWLDVAMDHAAVVNVSEALEALDGTLDDLVFTDQISGQLPLGCASVRSRRFRSRRVF